MAIIPTIERPADIDSMVGQHELVARLKIVMAGARIRSTRLSYVLLSEWKEIGGLMPVNQICSVEGCETLVSPKSARGFCRRHYAKWQKYGDPTMGATFTRRGMTSAEYQKWWHQENPGKRAAYVAKWRANNPEYGPASEQARRFRQYGITSDGYDALLAKQDGRCAVCDTPEPGGSGKWAIDHDHSCCPGTKRSCGRCIRGLLCASCNGGLGFFADDVGRLEAAAKYLKEWRVSK